MNSMPALCRILGADFSIHIERQVLDDGQVELFSKFHRGENVQIDIKHTSGDEMSQACRVCGIIEEGMGLVVYFRYVEENLDE